VNVNGTNQVTVTVSHGGNEFYRLVGSQ
jgi:hypothetical protein